MNQVQRNQFKRYYQKYKDLATYHKEIFGEQTSPHVPNKFSENLCRGLLKIRESPTKQYDGEKDGKTYEIKATCLPNHDQTFSSVSKPDVILWVCIDTSNDIMLIYNINKESLMENIKTKVEKRQSASKPKSDRVSIYFGKLKKELLMTISLNTIKEVKIKPQ